MPTDPMSEVLRRCMGIDAGDDTRQDFGDLNGGALQRPSEVAAELIRALTDEGFRLTPATELRTALRWPVGAWHGTEMWRAPFVASPGRRLRSGRVAGIGVTGQECHFSGPTPDEALARGPRWETRMLLSTETFEEAQAVAAALNLAYSPATLTDRPADGAET